jgi:hypothetical protein
MDPEAELLVLGRSYEHWPVVQGTLQSFKALIPARNGTRTNTEESIVVENKKCNRPTGAKKRKREERRKKKGSK